MRELIKKFKILLQDLRNYSEQKAEAVILTLKSYKRVILVFSIPVLFYSVYHLLLFSTPFLREISLSFKPDTTFENFKTEGIRDTARFISQQVNRIKRLETTYERYSTTQPFFIVNTTENKFSLYNRGDIVRQGNCSTGSYILLDAGDERKWMFETPKGLFRIQGKTESPVWRKPDWAFVEEGLPIPSSSSRLRYERGVLGDYALSIGNGYLIHGTLYKRLLGMPVTHGCVRMDDPDLEAVFNTLGIGSKVFIF